MDLQLSDKVVLITGASGGIGRALAEAFAAEGARVALHANTRLDELEEWVAEQPWRGRAVAVPADTTVPAEMEHACDLVRAAWGRIDVCVANAGAWPAADQRLDEAPEARIRRTIDVNLLGSLWTARAFFASLATTGARTDGHGASLVFVGSTAGRFGERFHADYATAKAGLVGLMMSLKNEIVHLDTFGRVNLVEPGWTVTRMARPALEQEGVIRKVVTTMPLRQLARAEDVARTVLWLASPAAARHVTGQTVAVAGGMEGRVLWPGEAIDEAAIRRRARE